MNAITSFRIAVANQIRAAAAADAGDEYASAAYRNVWATYTAAEQACYAEGYTLEDLRKVHSEQAYAVYAVDAREGDRRMARNAELVRKVAENAKREEAARRDVQAIIREHKRRYGMAV